MIDWAQAKSIHATCLYIAKLSLLGHSCMQSILVGLNNRRSEHLFFGGFLVLAAKRIRLWRKAKNDTGQEIGPPSAHGIIWPMRKTTAKTHSAEGAIEHEESVILQFSEQWGICEWKRWFSTGKGILVCINPSSVTHVRAWAICLEKVEKMREVRTI